MAPKQVYSTDLIPLSSPLRPSLTDVRPHPPPSIPPPSLAVMSHDDVIESADPAQPLAQRLADAGVGHVAGELAEAGVERRLQRQEGRV